MHNPHLRSGRMNSDLPDFTISSHGELLTLQPRTERGRRRLAQVHEATQWGGSADRILLKRERAREIVSALKFEGYSLKGEEAI
jgi:hypothetical protein